MSEDAEGGGRVAPWRNPDDCSEQQKRCAQRRNLEKRRRASWRDPNTYCDKKCYGGARKDIVSKGFASLSWRVPDKYREQEVFFAKKRE